MKEIISKEEFNKLISAEGKIRGMGIKPSVEFVLQRESKAGIERIEQALKELGYPIELDKIKGLSFYPIGLFYVFLASVEKLFGYDAKMFEEMGRFAVKTPLVLRSITKYLLSVGMWARTGSRYWEKFFEVGKHEIPEWSEEKKYLVNRIKNVELTPAFCQIVRGAHIAIMQMVVGKEVTCEETKCISRGDEYHEFILRW